MKINAIVQARLGSTRLPGKVLMEVKGKPLLRYLVERLNCCKTPDKIIVACPQKDFHQINLAVGDLVHVFGWDGDEMDVAGRFVACLEKYPCETFVRVCADSPLIDPTLVDAFVKIYELVPWGYWTSEGLGAVINRAGAVEIVDTVLFKSFYEDFDEIDREHVTRFFKKEPEYGVRLVVDTNKDFEQVKAAIEKMDRPHTQYEYDQCQKLLSSD